MGGGGTGGAPLGSATVTIYLGTSYGTMSLIIKSINCNETESVAYLAQFEDEFPARVWVYDTTSSKITCTLEMDTTNFTSSYILLDTADFATGCFLQNSAPDTANFTTRCILKLKIKLELETRPRTDLQACCKDAY